MIPLLLARIRIPIPAELAGPLMVIGAIALLIILIVLLRGQWHRAGLAALAALVLVFAGALFSVTAFGHVGLLAWRTTQDVVLVGAGLLAWQVRGRRFDIPALALAAAAYGLCAPMVSGLLAGSTAVRSQEILRAAVWALCFLGGVASLAQRLQPRWAGVLVGAVLGALLGSALSMAMAGGSLLPRLLLASAVHGLALGATGALALRSLSLKARS